MLKRKMVMTLLLTGLISGALLTGCGSRAAGENKKKKIGISQIVEYSALDENRKGFIKALSDNGYKDGENIEIDYQNAQGDMPVAQTIAQNLVGKKMDLIFTISTSSSQAAYNATKNIPIIISSVTDPVAAGLIKSLEKPGTNVTGTSDYIPIKKQLELFKLFAPKAKKIGVIYNSSEINSEVQIKELKDNASKDGYEIIQVGVTNTNEVGPAISNLVGKIDLLYVPTDQLVVSCMPIISKTAIEKKIPIIASEKGSVEQGALATQGINYYKLGYRAGEMAVKVLKGEKTSNIPVEIMNETEIIVNENTLKALSLEKPKGDNIIYINSK